MIFSEVVENIVCLKKLRISASYKRVFFVNNFFKIIIVFFFFLKAGIRGIWIDSNGEI